MCAASTGRLADDARLSRGSNTVHLPGDTHRERFCTNLALVRLFLSVHAHMPTQMIKPSIALRAPATGIESLASRPTRGSVALLDLDVIVHNGRQGGCVAAVHTERLDALMCGLTVSGRAGIVGRSFSGERLIWSMMGRHGHHLRRWCFGTWSSRPSAMLEKLTRWSRGALWNRSSAVSRPFRCRKIELKDKGGNDLRSRTSEKPAWGTGSSRGPTLVPRGQPSPMDRRHTDSSDRAQPCAGSTIWAHHPTSIKLPQAISRLRPDLALSWPEGFSEHFL
nr:hypothetical protein CFP56_29953 [Quercus suber]